MFVFVLCVVCVRLLAADAPQILPIALHGAWLTMVEAKLPVLEDANLLVNGTTLPPILRYSLLAY